MTRKSEREATRTALLRRKYGRVTVDAFALETVIPAGETVALADAAAVVFGVTASARARAKTAARVLSSRHRVGLRVSGRDILAVESRDNSNQPYMQMEACMYMMVLASVTAAKEQIDGQPT